MGAGPRPPGQFPPFSLEIMAEVKLSSVPDLLLVKRGLVFPSSTGGPLDDDQVCAVELELSAVGYALTSRLRERLVRCFLIGNAAGKETENI